MKKILFTISQLYKGGAETALVNLLNKLDYSKYMVDLLILNQVPVKDAVSLIDRIDKHVNICNAFEENKKSTIFSKIRTKTFYTSSQKEMYFVSALDFIWNKTYDWAFFWGEWCSPAFVALEVNAKVKAAWIHSDISRAEFFNAREYFGFFDNFDYFIFVSQHSMDSAIEAYPFVKNKATTIYNISDVEYIRQCAEEPVADLRKSDLPIILTCANFRPEKNHLRQIEAMAELKKRGTEFIWVNIGSTADRMLVGKVHELCRKYNLEDRFLILGAKENPYKYIQLADAVAVLSDHESWSMVITEAKILGKPVIATKTSGALEQIIDKETGMLADFNVCSIAKSLERILTDRELKKHIETNIGDFNNTNDILHYFDELIERGNGNLKKKDILYVIDDINYTSGAHSATKLQIKELMREDRHVTIYSTMIPQVEIRKELAGADFITLRDSNADKLYQRRLFGCLFDKRLTSEEKKRKLNHTIRGYSKKLDYEKEVLPYVADIFSRFSVVCVMSESSAYREAVAWSKASKKVQWIHTDYVGWKNYSEWTRKITANDSEIYSHFDMIVVLTESIQARFVELYPHLATKTIVNRNLMPVCEIKKKAEPIIVKNKIPVNFVTVGRMGSEKQYPRLIKILAALKQEGYQFHWTIIGGGELLEEIRKLVASYDLENEVKLTGAISNPFHKMNEADVFALLSSYEGLPNTIFESLILGTPVLATNVGGISTQVIDGETGWLVENNEESIALKIQYLLMNQDEIVKATENLKSYQYDNKSIMRTINRILLAEERV